MDRLAEIRERVMQERAARDKYVCSCLLLCFPGVGNVLRIAGIKRGRFSSYYVLRPYVALARSWLRQSAQNSLV